MRVFTLPLLLPRSLKKFVCLLAIILLAVVAVLHCQRKREAFELRGELRLQNTTTTTTTSDDIPERKSNALEQRDWHDYAAIASDARRTGLGEQGRAAAAAAANWTHDLTQLRATGFNAPLSDLIALERALPDERHEGCRMLSYAAQLPSVSIVITHGNEPRSVLLRTLHSLLQRTPAELLHEIMLVNDGIDSAQLSASFVDYVSQNVSRKVKVLHLEQRAGLMGARMAAARRAEAKLLVFMHAHVEATHNWLPPLLTPIVANPRTCTTPIIDTISHDTFEYIPAAAMRGGFNWQFDFVQLPLLSAEQRQLPAPHNNPVMNGGIFAMSAEFFWHLGAYDEGLRIRGAEQFELSFKIWMCGGRLLEVPCSRLGLVGRDAELRVQHGRRGKDSISKSYKRVAEVWMDEYKDALYEHMPKLTQIRAGDLNARKELRARLKCKSFKWYLEHIAPDLLLAYPAIEPADYANGALQSVANPKLCLDSLNTPARHMLPPLERCSPDLKHPYVFQHWQLSFRRDLQQQSNCLEVQSWQRNAPIWLWPCHQQGGNQFWYYDRQTQMLVHGHGAMERRCLELDMLQQRLYVNVCDFGKLSMKWHFGYVNQTAMNGFYKGL